ncbi:MAG TPA: hypothetical protein VHK25_00195 [Acidimicrobiales bacterium]|nr:hypothetical protein [Acidimicrobiales bacterium]
MTTRVRSRRRERTRLVAAVLAVALVGGLVAAVVAAIGGDDDASDGASPTSTTIDSGGIDVSAPDGWTAIPVAGLGFGIAVPPGWEAAVLAPEVLESLERSSPHVPGFLDNAHAAAEAGAVFYAAGVDEAGRVADVKVRAVPGAGIATVEQLEDFGRQLSGSAGLGEVPVEVVGDAERPTVRMRYGLGAAGGSAEAQGTETLVAGPGDIVWSVIVTSEDPATHEALAERIARTLAFAP